MDISDVRWYVVQSSHNSEYLAEASIRDLGFKTYLPSYRKIIRKFKKTELLRRPIFSGYLFAAFDQLHDNWRPINYAKGVHRLVSQSAEFIPPTPLGFVESLQESADADGYLTDPTAIDDTLESFQRGAVVKVTTGVLEGNTGKVVRCNNNRVVLLLSLLSRETELTLPRNCVSLLRNPEQASRRRHP